MFCNEIVNTRKLQMTKLETGSKYNIPLMNSLVLYVGVKAINLMHSNRHTPTQTTIAQGAHMDIFQNLAVDLDNEGKIFDIMFIPLLLLSAGKSTTQLCLLYPILLF